MDKKETLEQVKKVYRHPQMGLVEFFNDVVTLSIATTFRETGQSWADCWGTSGMYGD